jgi:hypothetical protein
MMTMSDNGSPPLVQATSQFEREFLAYRGRKPTTEETRKYLACDRLAIESSLDPMTIMAIVAGKDDSAEIERDLTAALVRLEKKIVTGQRLGGRTSPTASELRAGALGAVIAAILMCVLLQFQLQPREVGFMVAIIATAGACAAFAWWRART